MPQPSIGGEPEQGEPMVLSFDKACAVPPAEQEPSAPGVVKPRMSPKYPPKSPKYPADAKPGEKGVVRMLLLVNEEGYVTQAKVQKSSGSIALDRASLESSRDFRLEPGKVDGKPTCMWMTFISGWGMDVGEFLRHPDKN
jgi:protein TonB